MEPLRSRPRKMLPTPPANSLPPFPSTLPPHEPPFVIPNTRQGLVDALVKPVEKFVPQLIPPDRHANVDDAIAQMNSLFEKAPTPLPDGTESAHPFIGGECNAHARLGHIIHTGMVASYKATRNGLLGADFSTKLAAYLAHGSITARQIHWALVEYEEGSWTWEKWGRKIGIESLLPKDGPQSWMALGVTGGTESTAVHSKGVSNLENYSKLPGYGQGENEGTAAVRFELLWRDYMRLCSKKFGVRLFSLWGFRNDKKIKWKGVSPAASPLGGNSPAQEHAVSSERRMIIEHGHAKSFMPSPEDAAECQSSASKIQTAVPYQRRYSPTQSTHPSTFRDVSPSPQTTKHLLNRCIHGTTGQSLIDASARELLFTGYTSNRTRQNFASFLTKHLGIDWRLGAEWYECCLIDYDVCSNWANWQYVAGVGNDPRGEARIFNPVKQGFEYDAQGRYIKTWVAEIRNIGTATSGNFGSPQQSDGANPSSESDSPTPGQIQQGAAASTVGTSMAYRTTKYNNPARPIKRLENMLQPWTTPREQWRALGWEDVTWDKQEMWERPILRIDFRVDGKPSRGRRGFRRRGVGRVDRGGPAGGRRGGGGGPSGGVGYRGRKSVGGGEGFYTSGWYGQASRGGFSGKIGGSNGGGQPRRSYHRDHSGGDGSGSGSGSGEGSGSRSPMKAGDWQRHSSGESSSPDNVGRSQISKRRKQCNQQPNYRRQNSQHKEQSVNNSGRRHQISGFHPRGSTNRGGHVHPGRRGGTTGYSSGNFRIFVPGSQHTSGNDRNINFGKKMAGEYYQFHQGEYRGAGRTGGTSDYSFEAGANRESW